MQYNKNQFRKVNDKKVLKKVKKEWIVASVATLAFLGTSAFYGVSMNDVTVHAEQTTSTPSVQTTPSTDSQSTSTVNSASGAINGNSQTASGASSTASSIAQSDFKGSGDQVQKDSSVANSGVNTIATNSASVNGYVKSASNRSPQQNTSAEATSASNDQASASSANTDTVNAASDAVTQSNGSSLASSANSASQNASGNVSNANNNFNSLSNEYSLASSANVINNSLGSTGRTDDYNKINNDYTNISGAYQKASNAQSSLTPNSSSIETANGSIQADWNSINNSSDFGGNSATPSQNSIAVKSSYDVSEYTAATENSGAVSTASSAISQASATIAQNSASVVTAAKDLNDTLNDYTYQGTLGANDAWTQIKSGGTPQLTTGHDEAYNQAFQGVIAAHGQYVNDVTNEGTNTSYQQSYKDYIRAHEQSGATDYQNGNYSGDNDPTTAGNNVTAFDNYLDATYNNANNTSVTGVPNSGFIDAKKVNTTNNQSAQYTYGINYFLAKQGASDAETGKWNGHNNGVATSYNPNADSTNAYDQAYQGANDAIKQQFAGSGSSYPFQQVQNYNGNNSSYYQTGYNDVAQQTQQGVAFADNATHLYNILYEDNGTYNEANNSANAINTINITNDINNGDLGNYSELDLKLYTSNLNINGQNHIYDAQSIEYNLKSQENNNQSLMVENFRTIYGANYYGPFTFNNEANISFNNINYVGAQLLSASNNNTSFQGNTNSHLVQYYNSPYSSNVATEGNSGNNGQEDLEIASMTLAPGANYFGDTAKGDGGDATLIDSGTVTLGKNSNLVVRAASGTGGGGESIKDSNSDGVVINNSSGTLNVNKGADLDIVPVLESTPDYGAMGIYSYGNINVDGGRINIQSPVGNDGVKGDSCLMDVESGSVNVFNNGMLNIQSGSYGNANPSDNALNYGLLYLSSGNVNIYNRGNLIVKNLSNTNEAEKLIYGSIKVDDIGENGVQLQNTNNPNSTFVTGNIVGNNVQFDNGNGHDPNNWYYTLNVNSNSNGAITYNYTNNQNKNTSAPSTGTLQSNDKLILRSVPTVDFAGNIATKSDGNGGTIISGYAKVYDYNTAANNIYAGYAQGSSANLSSVPAYSSLTSDTTNLVKDDFTGKYYNQSIGFSGGSTIVPFSYDLKNTTGSNTFGVTLNYGISQVNLVLVNNPDGTPAFYSVVDGSGQTYVNAQSLANVNQADSDAIIDAKNGNDDVKQQNIGTYDANTGQYQDSYDSAKAGYQYFAQHPDLSDDDIITNAPNANSDSFLPNSFIKGYEQAKTDETAPAQKQGAQDFIDGKAKNSSVGDATKQEYYDNGYSGAQQGYQDAVSGATNKPQRVTTKSTIGYDMGYSDGQGAAAGYQLAESKTNPKSTDNPATDASGNQLSNQSKTAYQAVADAIQHYNGNNHDATNIDVSTSNGKSADYVKAYNTAINSIEQTNTVGQNNFLAGQPANDSSFSNAEKSTYDDAYSKAQTGFNEGLNNPKATATNANESAGIKAAQSGKQAYDQAVADYPNNIKTPYTGADANVYNATIDGLKSADGDTSKTRPTSNDGAALFYDVAKSQELGKTDAEKSINQNNDGQNKATINADQVTNTNASDHGAYTNGYNALMNGYNDGLQKSDNNTHTNNGELSRAYNDGNVLGQKAKGANDFLAGNQNTDSANTNYTTGFNNAKDGYQDGVDSNNASTASADDKQTPEYQRALAVGKAAQSDFHQAEQNAQPSGNSSKQTTADGVNDAIAKVQSNNGTNGGSYISSIQPLGQADTGTASYKLAYNQALSDAKEANADAINTFNAGRPFSDSNLTPANQAVYQQAYDTYQKGYGEGLKNDPAPTADMISKMTPNEKAGYEKAQQFATGYNDAIKDYYNNGLTHPDASKRNEPGYTDAINGLIDGLNTTDKPNPDSPVYEIARAESVGAKNGIIDAKDRGTSDHSAVPAEIVNSQAYKDAYQASKSGYNGGNNGNSQYDQPNNPIYTHSFNQGAQQRGADDFVNGTVTDDANNEAKINSSSKPYDKNYAQGVKDAQAAYYGQANNNSSASQTGQIASKEYQSGYQAAQTGDATAPDKSTNPDGYEAYWGAQAGANTGKNEPTDVNTNSLAYKSAKSQAQKEATNGAQQYLDDKLNNNTLAPVGSNALYNQGYNNQKAYDNGFDNPKASAPTNLTPGEKDAYVNGQNAISSYNNAKANADATQNGDANYNGAVQGYQDALKGTSFNPTNNMKSNNPTAYQAAYSKAYAEANAQKNNGAAQAIADNDNGSNKKPTAGVNNTQANNAFNQGYVNQVVYDQSAASKNTLQAAKDNINNDKKPVNDDDAYEGAKAGLDDGSSADDKYHNDLSKSSAYQNAYNQAYNQVQKDRVAGSNDFFNQVNGDNLNNPDKIKAAVSSKNGSKDVDSNAQNNGFDYQKGYAIGINDSNAQPTNNDSDAYKAGLAMAKQASAGYQAAQGLDNPMPNANPIKNAQGTTITDSNAEQGYQAAAQAFQDVKAGKSPANNANQSSSYQAAYSMAYNVDQAAKSNGSNATLNNPNSGLTPNSPYSESQKAESTLYNQGINDTQNGYNSIIQPKNDKSTAEEKKTAEYQAGASLGKQILNGAQSAANGDAKAPENKISNDGYQATLAAMKQVSVDATKHQLDLNNIKVPDNISNNAKVVYVDSYQAAAQAFNDDVKSDNKTDVSSQSPLYQYVYGKSFDNDQAAKQNGQNDALKNPNGNINNPYANDDVKSILYAQGNQAVKNGYNSVVSPKSFSNEYAGSNEYNAGIQLANSSMAGVQAAATNKPAPSDPVANASYQVAKLAINNSVNDAKNGKNLGSNGKLDPTKIAIPSNVSPAMQHTYLDIYKGGYQGYQNGLNGGSAKPDSSDPDSQLVDYSAAYSNAYQQGQKDIPAPTITPQQPPKVSPKPAFNSAILNNFLNGTHQSNFVSIAAKKAYDKAYADVKDGVEAALKDVINGASGNHYYNQGYEAGKHGLAGIRAAELGKKLTSDHNKAYIKGFDGYRAGKKAAEAVFDNSKHDLSNKGAIYSYAYKQAYKQEERYQNNLGIKQGIENAKKDHKIPKNFDKKHSKEYVKAYLQAYRREEKRDIPRYIYNLKTLFTHRNVKFSHKNRIHEYKKAPRYDAHIFKVLGLDYSKTGLPRYRVRNGYVTVRPDYVANLYYQTNFKKFRVIKPSGVSIHTNKYFDNNNVVKKLHKNDIFKVQKVVKYNGITRFYVGNGEYVTSDKTYVSKVGK
ncbi:hypothetical protein DY138_07080 [Apilactobacillus timberlakei]|uniref:DUF5776 domain-containing protein n=1 Tax=Apilactobacillus timberlakei TaxID=2008380 RepID=UPI00112AC8BA|nr:DUF5776 domain-containing protein [Apilactobacillus timberlakei]TPR17659.1 hypothetical protein DY138_07080 [Apilactobacillus timberlakei]TPR19472.1 hypothetical protein DY061_06985 [Apilactobacillus timberlakei]TPR20850.1 hypothetical protein DY083_07480 [Apilactobacillus timberlakei]